MVSGSRPTSSAKQARTAQQIDAGATEQLEFGRARRKQVPRSAHGSWIAPAGRPDPVDVLEAEHRDRLPELVPVRVGRMLASPFAFLRGAAGIMARDLACGPRTGIETQLCGDAHLSNFGVFAAPGRDLVFDVNDFDETLPGPFEWDVKRLVASAVVLGREVGLHDDQCRAIAAAAVASYRRRMAVHAESTRLQVWYRRVNIEIASQVLASTRRELQPAAAKARRRTSERMLTKLTTRDEGGRLRIVERPPLLVKPRVPIAHGPLVAAFEEYLESLDDARRTLIGRFHVVDFALKVVGVGSVGTRCYVVLLIDDTGAPLFLQIKEAGPSVLQPFVDHRAPGGHEGRRVVDGQQLMQAASDIFLGRSTSPLDGRHYYLRQLADMKMSFDVATMDATRLHEYVELCGWALARAHARAGDPATIAGYLGGGSTFDDAIASFGLAYADQSQQDYGLVQQAVRDGRLPTTDG